MITQNRRDFLRLHALWTTMYLWKLLGEPHYGILTVHEQEQRDPELWAIAIDGFLQVQPNIRGKLFSWRNKTGAWDEGSIVLR